MKARVRAWDAAVLRGATTLAHAFQTVTGHTSFFLTECATYVLMASVGVYIVDYFWPVLVVHANLWGVSISAFVLPLMLLRARIYARAEVAFLRDGRALPTWSVDWPLDPYIRLFNLGYFLSLHAVFLGFVVIPADHPWPNFIGWLWSPAYLASDYFQLVIPKPPGPSLFRAWLSSLSGFLRPLPVEG